MIISKSREEIETMDRCNRVVAQILAALAKAVAQSYYESRERLGFPLAHG